MKRKKICYKNLCLYVLFLLDLIINEKFIMLIFKCDFLNNVLIIGCFIEKII